MKKTLYLFVALRIVWATGFAQETGGFRPEWSYGVNGGVTSSKVNFTPQVYQQSLNQLSGGFTVRYITENHFGLQGELNLSQRGWQEHKDSIPDHRYTKSLLYAELPLLTHVYFNLGSRVRLVFNLGPQISYLLAERALEANIVEDPTIPEEAQPIQYTVGIQNRFDWGIAAGGGCELRTGIGSFVLEGRYYYGLSDIYRNRSSDFYAGSAHQVTGVKLTWFFTTK
jgi:hypothetical protein